MSIRPTACLGLALLTGCGAAPSPEALTACTRLAQRPTVEVTATSAGLRSVVTFSEVIEGMTAGGVAGTPVVTSGWQIQAAFRQETTSPGDPVLRSRLFASKVSGSATLLFATPLVRTPTSVELDLAFEFKDSLSRVTPWRLVTPGLDVEPCD